MKQFTTLIKPASALCNLRCRYCFYCDEAEKRGISSYGIMEKTTAEHIMKRAFAFVGEGNVTFAFQGGEPTLAGLDFFREFISFAEQEKPGKVSLAWSLQTNGVLLDENWCAFLAKKQVLVGVSLDGWEENHNHYRVDKAGKGSFKSVWNGVRLLKKYGVEFNFLTVITPTIARHPAALYKFYQSGGFTYVQLIPCLAPLGSEQELLSPEGYGAFLKGFFDKWYEDLVKNHHYISVRLFDNLVTGLRTGRCEQCGMNGGCTPQFVVEADGSVFPCDFYVLDQYLCGNVITDSVETIGSSEGMNAFLSAPKAENPQCAGCGFGGICGGRCARYASFYASSPGYCPLQDFLKYAGQRLQQIANGNG